MKPYRIIHYVMGAVTLGAFWPSGTKPSQATAVTLKAPPTQNQDINENTVYKYYLDVAGRFDRQKPGIEIVLRSAASEGTFIKSYEDGFLTFTDQSTGHKLSINGQGITFSN